MLDDRFGVILVCCINNTLFSMIYHKATTKSRATMKEIVYIKTYSKDSQHVSEQVSDHNSPSILVQMNRNANKSYMPMSASLCNNLSEKIHTESLISKYTKFLTSYCTLQLFLQTDIYSNNPYLAKTLRKCHMLHRFIGIRVGK